VQVFVKPAALEKESVDLQAIWAKIPDLKVPSLNKSHEVVFDKEIKDCNYAEAWVEKKKEDENEKKKEDL